MALVKYNNRSILNVTALGSIASGDMNLITTNTISSGVSSSSFTSSIDSTYDTYLFKFINIHPSSDGNRFRFQGSTNGGSSYGVTITSTFFKAFHAEADNSDGVSYDGQNDLAQSTSYQQLNLDADLGADDDQGLNGTLYLFSPSNTTFVKHFLGITNFVHKDNYSVQCFIGGYFNTTSAIDAIDFQVASNNIDSGVIKMYGLSKS
tara:strand:+ start:167 stop:784 length:618 start_codon:yes stop_codon:yes gene_type:complete